MKRPWSVCALALIAAACTRGEADIYAPAGGCYAVSDSDGESFLLASDAAVAWSDNASTALKFRLQSADLGAYVFYDDEQRYLIAAGAQLRVTADKTDIAARLGVETSAALWVLESADRGVGIYRLRHQKSGRYIAEGGLADEDQARLIALAPREGCAVYPELSLDAAGTPRAEPFGNGDLFGVADVHSHLFTNLGFGNSGIFHGSPFHPLGVEHALEDCDDVHGEGGRRDLVNYFLSGEQDVEIEAIAAIFTTGRIDEYNHATTGYPVFASWPDGRNSPTHQTQYYRWLERAWMGGLRLIVQLATGNSVLCDLMTGVGAQTAAYSCNDMVSVDRTIDEVRALERYIDAQHGGPGKGWFRIVESPAAARREIGEGKLAVVLGIEISNLFDCFLTPPEGMPVCDRAHILREVEEYWTKGVRVIFPVHKYDNGFAPGDGQRGALEIGNLLNSGHWSDYRTDDCPDFWHLFDDGGVSFGGLNEPRREYFSPPPLRMGKLADDPLQTVLPLLPKITEPGLTGNYCKAHGLTDLGRILLDELITRGIVVDIAHLPRRAVVEAIEHLKSRGYPAVSTHGMTYNGLLYEIGGLPDSGFGTCGEVGGRDTLGNGFRTRTRELQAANGLPAPPLAFDFNGFAGSRGPRFGEASSCAQPQTRPVEYPFHSFDGGVEFTRPRMGERSIDFNTEGMLHIGLLPELIEDVRREGMSDADLEPLFRTAESFVRVWEAGEKVAGR